MQNMHYAVFVYLGSKSRVSLLPQTRDLACEPRVAETNPALVVWLLSQHTAQNTHGHRQVRVTEFILHAPPGKSMLWLFQCGEGKLFLP